MRRHLGRQAIAALALIAMACCAPRADYRPPVSDATTTATIVGLRVPTRGLADDVRVVVSAVDGKWTGGGFADWDRPVTVDAGRRLVQLAAGSQARELQIALQVTLEPGKTYRPNIDWTKTDAPPMIWLEATPSGAPAGDKVALPWRWKSLVE